MKKANTIQLLSAALLLLSLLLSACTKTDTPIPTPDSSIKTESVDRALKKGFEIKYDVCLPSIEPLPAGYTSEHCIFDIDNVTMDFYYGFVWALKNKSFPSFNIYFSNGFSFFLHTNTNKLCLVKEVEEEFISEKYMCTEISTGNSNMHKVEYNYHETFKIPKDVFTEEKGTIYFIGYGDDAKTAEEVSEVIFYVNIWYKVDGDKVILSEKEF